MLYFLLEILYILGVAIKLGVLDMLENNISVCRAEKKMTQQELADLVGVSRQSILSIEKNRYNPSLILALKIAKALDKEVTEIFEYKEE